MQVDIGSWTPESTTDIDNIDQGTAILAGMLAAVKIKHPDWSSAWQLRGAVAAYNFGVDDVDTQGGIDRGSASTCSPCDGNYSWDTVNRARWFAGTGSPGSTSSGSSFAGGKQDCYKEVLSPLISNHEVLYLTFYNFLI